MPKPSLTSMTVEELLNLRDDIGKVLARRADGLRRQLARLSGESSETPRKVGALKGRKVAPKYRGPSGETWAGRGARPHWLVAAIKGGKRVDDFLIDKSARKGRKKRKGKR